MTTGAHGRDPKSPLHRRGTRGGWVDRAGGDSGQAAGSGCAPDPRRGRWPNPRPGPVAQSPVYYGEVYKTSNFHFNRFSELSLGLRPSGVEGLCWGVSSRGQEEAERPRRHRCARQATAGWRPRRLRLRVPGSALPQGSELPCGRAPHLWRVGRE